MGRHVEARTHSTRWLAAAVLLAMLVTSTGAPGAALATEAESPGTTTGPADPADAAGPATPDPVTVACPDAVRAGFPDLDRADPHAPAIDCIAWWRIADGFPDGTFRSRASVTRGQLASFLTATVLASGVDLAAPGPGFPDTTNSVHARAIARLARAELAAGRTDGTFAPGDAVTRGQLATFLVRILDHLGVALPDGEARSFSDVAGTEHEAAIMTLAAARVALGGSDGAFRPGATVTRGQMSTFLARTLGLAVAAGTPVRAAHAAVDAAALTAFSCPTTSTDVTRADRVLAGEYTWSPHPPAQLGTALTWTEDPFDDGNWRFQFHALRWLWPLVAATHTTGDARYLDHAMGLARSWVVANPRSAPRVPEAWGDHATAWRTQVLTCLARQGAAPRWLEAALTTHQRALADPDFYVEDGNHALNQDVGLLVAACHTQAWDRRDLAIERIDRLVRAGVDTQGVMDEQAVEYQDYNHERYQAAITTMQTCGRAAPAALDRVALMPEVLAHMTLPDGTYETLGDTDRRVIKNLGHPATTWIRTQGTDGAPPPERTAVYDAGFYLTRSGWGTEQPLAAETFLSARFGPQPFLHGHDDHGSITLYAQGQRLLTDPGKYRYGNLPGRLHVVSAAAHNTVSLTTGCQQPADGPSQVTGVRAEDGVDHVRIHVATCRGTRWTRHVAFRGRDGAVVVLDELQGAPTSRWVQRWQLELGAQVDHVDRLGASVRCPSGASLLVEQLVPTAAGDAVTGGTDPLRGWVSRRYGSLEPAANLAFTTATGDTATFVTVLRPGAGAAPVPSQVSRDGDRVEVRLPDADGEVTIIRLGG
jgi:hypothetical protein